jgi:hypothetical protein
MKGLSAKELYEAYREGCRDKTEKKRESLCALIDRLGASMEAGPEVIGQLKTELQIIPPELLPLAEIWLWESTTSGNLRILPLTDLQSASATTVSDEAGTGTCVMVRCYQTTPGSIRELDSLVAETFQAFKEAERAAVEKSGRISKKRREFESLLRQTILGPLAAGPAAKGSNPLFWEGDQIRDEIKRLESEIALDCQVMHILLQNGVALMEAKNPEIFRQYQQGELFFCLGSEGELLILRRQIKEEIHPLGQIAEKPAPTAEPNQP